MTKQFSSSVIQRKGKGLKAVLPFEFDDNANEEIKTALPTKIHLIPIGQWEHDMYGPIIINAADIREYLQNFNAKIRKGVFITAGHEGFDEKPAVAWIQEVESRDNGLWGTVEWNELGKEALNDKQFKFFSPEMFRDYEDPETHQFYRNVLTGGALTKSPYFKELESIVFSDRNIKNNFEENKSMKKTLEEVLAIEDIATLTAEDKEVLKESAATLTEEQKAKYFPKEETAEEKTAREIEEKKVADAKALEEANIAAGLNADGTEKINASEKKTVQISASELDLLKNKANEGAQAFKELNGIKLDKAVNELVFSETNKSGAFLPKSKDGLRAFMETLNDAQKAKFSAILKDLPKTQIFKEVGGGNNAIEGSAQEELNNKVEAKMKANDKMKYSDALKQVMSENEGLEQRYDEELGKK